MIDRNAFLGRAAQQLRQLRVVGFIAGLLAIGLLLAVRELPPHGPRHDVLRGLAMAFGLLSSMVAVAVGLFLLSWRRGFDRALLAMPDYDHNPPAFWAMYGYLARPLWRARAPQRNAPHSAAH